MRIILVPDTQEEINAYANDINYEIKGRQIRLTEQEFRLFWKSDVINKFYEKTRNLIDDFETTIITDDNDILILKKIIEESAFSLFEGNFKMGLLSLVSYAAEKKSGIIFIF